MNEINNEVMTYLVKSADALETWISQQQIELDETAEIKGLQKDLQGKINDIEDLFILPAIPENKKINMAIALKALKIELDGLSFKVNIIMVCTILILVIFVSMLGMALFNR